MKKPEKNGKKKLSAVKRGIKRGLRFKASRKKVASQRAKDFEAKKLHKKKMDELMEKILASRTSK